MAELISKFYWHWPAVCSYYRQQGHTATTGTNHTLTGTGAVYCNTASLSDPAFDGLALPPVGDTDVIVRFHNASSSTNTQGVVFASTASETGYLLQIQGNSPATVSFWKLGGTGAGFKHSSAGYQTIATGNDSYFYKAEIRDADIKIYSASTVDGLYTLRYTFTDTEHRGTDVRLRSGAISTASTGKHLDYLSVDEIVAPIPDPPPWPDGTYDVSWSANGGADTASSTLYVGDIFEYASPTFCATIKRQSRQNQQVLSMALMLTLMSLALLLHPNNGKYNAHKRNGSINAFCCSGFGH